ncbi:MAG: Uma2 family endonuclease [Planctomycetes bacterium]|nr:Uma2 family endonuclease [Planctomycetota bacterium]
MSETGRAAVGSDLRETLGFPPFPVRRFTVNEYHRMRDADVFPHEERLELLEGWIATPMTRRPPHDVALWLAGESIRLRLPEGRHLRTQSAITTGDSEPEPDLAVVHGAARAFVERHPGPTEIGLLVEVADSSLDRDRTLKARLYARAGIPRYWILDLEARSLEVYEQPSGPAAQPFYHRRTVFGDGSRVRLVLGDLERGELDVRELLP